MIKKNVCTIEEWSVDWSEIGNSLVCTHEYMHQILTITTIYGAIQRQIKFYADHFPMDLSLKRIQYELFKQVRLTQECCATFCSVMQVADKIEDGKNLIPASYLIYYNKYYNCIKSQVNSTSFAFIFAETIAQLCMNNQVHIKIMDYLENKQTIFNPLPFSPDICFKTIINKITPNILKEIIDSCNCQNPDPFSDINNELYWGKSDLDGVKKLNDIVFMAVYKYLSHKFSELNILTLEVLQENIYSWIDLLNEKLISRYGNIGFSYNEKYEHPYKVDDNILLTLECLDTVKIYNQPYMRANRGLSSDDMLGINYLPYHDKLKFHTFLCEDCFFDRNGNWYQFNSNGTLYDSAYFHYKQLSNFICANSLFVIGISAERKSKDSIKNEINFIYKDLKSICKDSKIHFKNFSRYNIFFYMFGKFSYWLDYLVGYSICKFDIILIEDKNASGNKRIDNFAMIAIYSATLPGIFIKCFNNMSYSNALKVLYYLNKQDMVIPNKSKDSLIITQKMDQAFHAIDAFWFEF